MQRICWLCMPHQLAQSLKRSSVKGCEASESCSAAHRADRLFLDAILLAGRRAAPEWAQQDG